MVKLLSLVVSCAPLTCENIDTSYGQHFTLAQVWCFIGASSMCDLVHFEQKRNRCLEE